VALPPLQSERPQHQTEHDEYLGTVLQTLESVGLGAFIRGENTADMVELQPKDLDTVRPSYFKADGTTPRDGYTQSEAMRQDERRQEFRYEEEAKAAKLARITADKSALLARMVTAAVGKHAGLLARLRAGNEMKHEQVKPDGSKETVSSKYLFDGVGMMNDFIAYLKKAVRADEVDFHMDGHDRRNAPVSSQNPLPDMATPEQLTARAHGNHDWEAQRAPRLQQVQVHGHRPQPLHGASAAGLPSSDTRGHPTRDDHQNPTFGNDYSQVQGT